MNITVEMRRVRLGNDVYHNGKNDAFVPPIMGSPVYFKFGTHHATVEQAFRKTIDDIYNFKTSVYNDTGNGENPGHFHLLLVEYYRQLMKPEILVVILSFQPM